jgi:hypothetical protein
MFTHRKIFLISLALIIALLGSGVMVPSIQTQAAAINPSMRVTLLSGGSTYAATVFTGRGLTFQAQVANTGNVPLQVLANLTVPQNWDVDEDKYSDCPEELAVNNTCTITWKFTPQVSGQVYLRVYVKGIYTDSSGGTNRITQAPAFIFNVQSSGQAQGGGSVTTPVVVNPNPAVYPNMRVTLLSGGSTYAATVYAGNGLTFQAQVTNTGSVPLQVLANLTVPQGWDVDEDKYSDCPEELAVNNTCTITWKFTPQASGQVYLWVYVKGIYAVSSTSTNRFTQAPVFIFNVQPPKGQ